MPEELVYLWAWFCDARTDGPLTFTELHHWSRLTQRRLLAWEVDVLRALDRLYWEVTRD